MSVPIYMIDFEGSASSGILEYGVVEILGGQINRTWTRLCRPIGRIAQRDRLTHGLSDTALSDCDPMETDWTFFSGLRETGVLAAHHAVVEAGLIKTVWPCPRLAPDFSKPESAATGRVAQWGPWIDSLALYRRIYPQLTGYGLDALVKQFRLEDALSKIADEHCPANRRDYHRALYDALASALLLQALIQLPDYHNATIADWIGWSRSSANSAGDAQMALDL
jgi:DNA polymerase III alpha subunit (gram-positive type)